MKYLITLEIESDSDPKHWDWPMLLDVEGLQEVAVIPHYKLKIYSCDEHDHTVVEIDPPHPEHGKEVCSNDYSVENLYRLADHLGWEVENIKLSDEEFSDRFA